MWQKLEETDNHMADKIFTRDVAWRPKTFNDAKRSVRVVAVSENPIRVWDWKRSEFVYEVLIINGLHLPTSGKVPLLDSHNRASVTGVLGSATNFGRQGNCLECDVYFSGTSAGRDAALKVKEGHLTDFSVGYAIMASQWISDGETVNIGGREIQGPVKLTTKWGLKELSVTPIGADQTAKARSWGNEPPPQASDSEAAPDTQEEIPQPSQEQEDQEGPPPESPEETPPEQAESASDDAPDEETQRQATDEPDAKAPQDEEAPPQTQPPEPKESIRSYIFSGLSSLKPKAVTVVDMIFYAFTALAVLFLIRGLF